jgi:ribonuclease HII
MKTTCGIDEAGRGPVIGPMVLACAVFDSDGVKRLNELKVRDSKQVSPARRRYLEPFIKKIAVEYGLSAVSPSEIDRLRKKKTLNQIEADKTASLICALKSVPGRIVIDSADAVAENYKRMVESRILGIKPEMKLPPIVSEHKADANYVEVGAASILAKVERDRQVDKLKEKYGDFGSGYPSDETTQKYIKKVLEKGSLPDIVRKSWNTVKCGAQKRLGDY